MPEHGDAISERELDVLNCLAEGASNREIAETLDISPNTVKVHVRNIFTKLGVSSRTEATTVALQKGIVVIPGVEVETDGDAQPGREEEAVAATGAEAAAVAAPTRDVAADEAQPADPEVEGVAPPLGAEEKVAPERGNQRLALLLGAVAILALLLAGLATANLWGEAATATAEPFVEVEVGEKWLASRPLRAPRAHHAVASVGLNLYAIGGETGDGVSNDVSIYETHEHRWRAGMPKLTAVADAGAAVLAGEIYVAGGRLQNGQATAVVEAYSPLNDGWRPLTPLPRPVAGGLAVASDGLLYLFGGQDGETILNDAYVYDPAQQQWQALPPLQQARAFAAGGALGGQLYVVGGSDGDGVLASCEVFSPVAQSWAPCPAMLQARAAAGAAVLHSKLYVIGGEGEERVTTGEVYDARQETWAEIPTPMLDDAAAGWPYLGVANVETRIYALGGMRAGALADDTFVYTPLSYQFFIPAASTGGEE